MREAKKFKDDTFRLAQNATTLFENITKQIMEAPTVHINFQIA